MRFWFANERTQTLESAVRLAADTWRESRRIQVDRSTLDAEVLRRGGGARRGR